MCFPTALGITLQAKDEDTACVHRHIVIHRCPSVFCVLRGFRAIPVAIPIHPMQRIHAGAGSQARLLHVKRHIKQHTRNLL